jgi:hypothetical protein
MSQILVRNLSAGDNVRTSGIRSIIRWLQKTLGLRKTNAVYLALRVRPTSAVWAFLPGSDQKQRVGSEAKGRVYTKALWTTGKAGLFTTLPSSHSSFHSTSRDQRSDREQTQTVPVQKLEGGKFRTQLLPQLPDTEVALPDIRVVKQYNCAFG